MIKVDIKVDDEYFIFYWSDGLIVLIFIGFIGYLLSCGGFVMDFVVVSIIIILIVFYNLNVRFLVLLDFSVLFLKVLGREESYLVFLDLRIVIFINDMYIIIKKVFFNIKMV